MIRTRRPVISSVFHSRQGFPAVALHVPVFKGDDFRGSIAILLDFSLIAKHYLDDIAIGKTGYAWMVDRKGIELYSPLPGHTGKSVFDNYRNYPTILPMAEEMVRGRQGVATYFHDQVRGQHVEWCKKHAVYLPIQIADSYWSIAVVSSEEEIVASLAGLRNRLLLLMSLLIIGSLVFSYYAMRARAIVREEEKRRKTEKELQESRARFQSLFLSMNEGMALHELCLDAGGRPVDYVLLDVNRAFERIFGISREKAVGQRGSALFGIEPAPFLGRYAGTARTGVPSHFETTDALPGKTLLVSVFSPAQGQFATLFDDITDRKKAEAELRRSEERYHELYDEAPAGYHEIDREGRIVQINKRELEMLGYAAEEALGRAVWDFADEPEAEATVRAILAGQVSPGISCDQTYRRKDGTTVPVQVYTRPIRDREGRIAGARSTVQDIGEHKRLKNALEASEENFRRFLDASPLGKRVVSQEGETLYVNQAALDIFGYDSLEEWRKDHPVRRYTEESYAGFKIRREQRRLGEEGPPEYEIDIVTKQGELRNIHVWRKKIPWNAADHYQVVYHDISDRKRALSKLQEAMGRLTRSVAASVQTMAAAVEARDPYTAGHQMRSMELACAIAAELALPEEKVAAIRLAGSIHDIGKLSIPSEILSKPTRLSQTEFLLIKEHAQRGFEILKNVESPWPLAEIVRQHHERMDGSGYPRNLKGEEVCLEARVLAVADVVESLASHRPYRPSMGIDAALKEIEQGRGILYDDAVADACLRLFREKGYLLATT